MSNEDPDLPVFLTTEQLAEMLHISKRTLEDWRYLEKGPAHVRMGAGRRALVLYELSDVEAWVSANRKGGGV